MGRTDQELLARLRIDPAAFEELYLRHVGKVVAAVARRAGDPAEVRALVAVAFARIHEAVGRYDPARSSPLPWILAVTAGVVAERRLPDGMVAERLPVPALARASGGRALDAAERGRLERQVRAAAPARQRHQAMVRLPPGERAMVELVQLDGLTPIQAAEALGVWPSVARLRLARAERKLARSAQVHPPPAADAGAAGAVEPLDEVGPLELELLGELRTTLYDPRWAARTLRAARHRRHRAMAGSRRLTTAPALLVALAALLGGAFLVGQLLEPTSFHGTAQGQGTRRVACYQQLDQRATATATAVGDGVWPPGAPALQACLSAWKRQELQLARSGVVRHVVPVTPSYVLCQQRDGTVGVFPNPRQLSLDDACASIGARVPDNARFGGATANQVRTFDLDLRARLRQAGLGTGCDPFTPLLETIRASMAATGLRGWTIRDRTSAQGVDPVNGVPIFRPDGGKRWTRFSVNPVTGQVTIGTAPDGACRR
ncbi:MAG TPA: RNA polymerase sigma factor [Actinomycetes bacterium]